MMDSEIIIKNGLDYFSDIQPNDTLDLQEEIAGLFDDLDEDEIEVEDEDDSSDDEANLVITKDAQEHDSNSEHNLYLREEEQEVIDNCTDPILKHLLLRNRVKALNLTGMCRKYFDKVQELNKLVRETRDLIKNDEELKTMKNKPSRKYDHDYKHSYFQTAVDFLAPKNDDCRIKKANKEHFFLKCSEGRRWSLEQRIQLLEAVVLDYFKYRTTQINIQIKTVNQHIKNEIDESKINALIERREELEKEKAALKLGNPKVPPPLDGDVEVDWKHIALIDLKGKRTPQECKAMWYNYVHPQINKSPWTAEENENIKELVLQYQNKWDVIAKELGTNRSPYLVFVHFKTDLYDSFKRGRFEPIEDTNLVKAVEKCRLGDYIPWSRVKHFCGDRAKYQLYHRYKYYLEPRNIKKGAFTEAEDALLMYLINTLGKDYTNIAQLIPNRTSVQLRNRYTTYLEKVRFNLGNFTVEEDQTILNHVKETGETWRSVANKLNRCRAHVRQRYLTLARTLEKNPSLKLDDIPRRKQNYLTICQKQRHERMNRCLSKLEEFDGIPTLRSVELILQNIARKAKDKKWKVNECTKTYTKTKSKVEQELLDYLRITCKTENCKDNNIDSNVVSDASLCIVNLLEALGGNINMFNNGIDESSNYITHEEKVILSNIREKCDIMNCDAPGTSSQSSDFQETDNPIELFLPPSVNSLTLVRGLLLYFKMNNDVDEESMESVDVEVSNKEYHSKSFKADSVNQFNKENQFKDILYAIFKWPGMLSEHYPEGELDDDEVVVEQQAAPRKAGRPVKKVYDKVLKMIEAKRKKREEANITNNEESVENATVNNENEAATNTDEATAPPTRKRGRPKKEVTAVALPSDELTYIPRRSHVKAKEGTLRTNKSNRLPREALLQAFNNGVDSSSTTSEVNDETSPNSSNVNSPTTSAPTNTERVPVQNVTNSNELKGNPVILKRVDPKNDKVLRELLKNGKIKLIPSGVNKGNNNNKNQNKQKTFATYSRKHPANEVIDSKGKRLCLERENATSSPPQPSFVKPSNARLVNNLLRDGQLKQEMDYESDDEFIEMPFNDTVKEEIGLHRKTDSCLEEDPLQLTETDLKKNKSVRRPKGSSNETRKSNLVQLVHSSEEAVYAELRKRDFREAENKLPEIIIDRGSKLKPIFSKAFESNSETISLEENSINNWNLDIIEEKEEERSDKCKIIQKRPQ